MKRDANARAVARDVLERVETGDAFADLLLAHRLATAELGAADQRLVTQLVYGTLAWQGRLDHHLTQLVDRPLDRLDAPVRTVLRLGLYQLLFLDRVPAYAAIDTSVSLLRHRGAAGFVNAVLRRAAAEPAALTLPSAEADPLGRLAVEWSHPRWLVERWSRDLDEPRLVALLAANNRAPRTAVRVNRTRTTPERLAATLDEDGIATTPGRWHADALVLSGGAAALREHRTYLGGQFTFQSEASQLIGLLVAARPGMRILDACAAPGGKTGHLAEQLGGQGRLLALDPRATALRSTMETVQRLHVATIVTAAVADARRPPTAEPFDAILVDAPCSGLGTLRRHPEIRWRRTQRDVDRLAALQGELLRAVSTLLAPGGALVYAVCTDTVEETTGVVDAFLARTPGIERDGVASLLSPDAATALVRDDTLRTTPSEHDLDGFFAVRLRAAARE